VQPVVRPLTAISRDAVSLLGAGILMKPATNIHHVIGHWSKVKVILSFTFSPSMFHTQIIYYNDDDDDNNNDDTKTNIWKAHNVNNNSVSSATVWCLCFGKCHQVSADFFPTT